MKLNKTERRERAEIVQWLEEKFDQRIKEYYRGDWWPSNESRPMYDIIEPSGVLRCIDHEWVYIHLCQDDQHNEECFSVPARWPNPNRVGDLESKSPWWIS